MRILDRLKPAPESQGDEKVEAAQAALARDRAERSEQAAAAILQVCERYRVHLQTQVTITGSQIETRVILVPKESP